jgi:hypothetical protein
MVARVCVLGNAGTYNNQWMVLDATKIKVGAPLPPADVLWIAERAGRPRVLAVVQRRVHPPDLQLVGLPGEPLGRL